jgi:uncharacterized phage-associated protein
MACSAEAVANYFLDKAREDGVHLSPMQVQKLVYFAHGWHLALTGEPLIDEIVEAWEWGPVIPSIYHEFKMFGSSRITSRAVTVRGGALVEPSIDEYQGRLDRGRLRAVLDKVWQIYGKYSAIQMSNLTHRAGSPWAIARNDTPMPDRRNIPIPDDVIRRHFYEIGQRNVERNRQTTAAE